MDQGDFQNGNGHPSVGAGLMLLTRCPQRRVPCSHGHPHSIVTGHPADAANDAVELHDRCGMASEAPSGGQVEERQGTVSAKPDPSQVPRTEAPKLVDGATGTGTGMEDHHRASLA